MHARFAPPQSNAARSESGNASYREPYRCRVHADSPVRSVSVPRRSTHPLGWLPSEELHLAPPEEGRGSACGRLPYLPRPVRYETVLAFASRPQSPRSRRTAPAHSDHLSRLLWPWAQTSAHDSSPTPRLRPSPLLRRTGSHACQRRAPCTRTQWWHPRCPHRQFQSFPVSHSSIFTNVCKLTANHPHHGDLCHSGYYLRTQTLWHAYPEFPVLALRCEQTY